MNGVSAVEANIKKSKKAIDLNGFQFSLSSTGCIMRSHELETHITFCFNEAKEIWDIHITDENKHRRNKNRKIASIASFKTDELFPTVMELLGNIVKFLFSVESKEISEINSIKGKYESYSLTKGNIKLKDEHFYIEESGHEKYKRETIFPVFPNISQYFFKENNFQRGCISELIDLIQLPSIILLKKDCGEQLIAIHEPVCNFIFKSQSEDSSSKYFIISFDAFVEFKESFVKLINQLININGNIIEAINEHFPIKEFFDWVLEQIDLLPIKINSDGIEIEFN